MNILGLIPARAGSKRVMNKNIRVLGDKPLLAWTIEAAKTAQCLQRLIVSTDEQRIAELARSLGAEVPWLRPPALASDTANVIDVVLEVLDRIEADKAPLPDAVMLLQPTSPFRRPDTIERAANLFRQHGSDSVISVSPTRSHPQWCKRVDNEGMLSDYEPVNLHVRSQDLPPVYRLNGVIYLAATPVLRKARSFYSESSRALIMDKEVESLDIDTPFDWLVAETIVAHGELLR